MVKIPTDNELWGDEVQSYQEANSPPSATAVNFDPVPPEIVDPFGEVIDATDADALIDAYERLERIDRNILFTKIAIRTALANMTEGVAKTRRVAGRRRTVAVTMPDDSYEQSILREAWEAYPQHRDKYLRIASLAPQIRELKKLVNTAGMPDLNTFRDMLTKANRGPTGTPTVKIEV